MNFVYPTNVLHDASLCKYRAILAPTNAQIDEYNDEILRRIDGITRQYVAADSLKELDDLDSDMTEPQAVLDWVAQHRFPGQPPHTLNVKVNGVYRLLRNFSLDRGLVKNMRCLVVDVGHRLVTVRLLRMDRAGIEEELVLLPRISFTYGLRSGHTLLRRQFPLAPAYATTFNSCQGLTLDRVGVDLTVPVFSHGQLYTALSRIRHRTHARVLPEEGRLETENVTYVELLN